MLKNHIKVAIRNLFKQKEYAFINILGLSIGMACCLLIALFVSDEYSYDNFHRDGDRIYRMALERKYPDHSTFYAVVPHSFSEVMVQDFPEIEAVCKLNANNADVIFRYEDENGDEKIFEEERFFHADSNFFNFFTVRLLKGNPAEALVKPNSIVITESAAAEVAGKADTTVIAAFYVAHGDVEPDELDGFVAGRLARYKCPRLYTKVEALPKGPNGKLLRRHLRQTYEDAMADSTRTR